jgi:hypothetical protein
MASFEKLQELWQQQVAPIPDVTPALRAYGRRQNWITAGKALVVGSILLASLIQARSEALRVAGLLVVALAVAVFLTRDAWIQRSIARVDFGSPSVGFVNTTIESLLAQRNVPRRYSWWLAASAVVAVNLILHGSHKVWMRVVISGMPLAALKLGLWVRRMRFDYECAPLLRQLREVQAALEDRPE